MARRGLHPADQGGHRAGDLPHGGDRHRVARQPRARGRAGAAGARLLLLDDGRRPGAGPDRGERLRAGLAASTPSRPRPRARRPRSRSPRRATPRPAWSASSRTTCCPRASSRRSSRTRSCASSCWRSSSPRRSRCSPTASASRSSSVFEVASKVIFGMIRLIMWAAPIGAFGGMAYTVSVFGAASLQSLAHADGRLLGHLRVLRLRGAGRGRARERVLDLPDGPADPRRAADHRRHLVVGDRAAAPAGQAAGRGRVASR